MRNPGISLVLAITLLMAGASVAPATCCVPKASRTVQAVDCCETMVDCPRTPEAGRVALVSAADPAATATALLVDSQGTPAPDRLITKSAFAEALPEQLPSLPPPRPAPDLRPVSSPTQVKAELSRPPARAFPASLFSSGRSYEDEVRSGCPDSRGLFLARGGEPALPPPDWRDRLKEAIVRAAAENPEIAEMEARIAAARHRLPQATALPDPEIELGLKDVPVSNPSLTQRPHDDGDDRGAPAVPGRREAPGGEARGAGRARGDGGRALPPCRRGRRRRRRFLLPPGGSRPEDRDRPGDPAAPLRCRDRGARALPRGEGSAGRRPEGGPGEDGARRPSGGARRRAAFGGRPVELPAEPPREHRGFLRSRSKKTASRESPLTRSPRPRSSRGWPSRRAPR